MPDLRSFIETVRRERPRDIVDVHRSVSGKYETTAILTKLERAARHPILFFHDIVGSPFPVVSNVCGTQTRLALALGCSARELRERYAEACRHTFRPELSRTGPAQEKRFAGKDVDLKTLPQLIYHQDDAQNPYLTAAIIVARDPESGKCNLSFHRLMVIDSQTTSIYIARGKHLSRIYGKYESQSKPMPIAAFLGVHPACCLGALYTGEAEVDEYDIIGGLLGAPLPVVSCLTNDLHVPAEAEFVLEGFVSPAVRVKEGPFGEFTGYSNGAASSPVFTVRALTSRHDPIFQDIISGHLEHLQLPLLGMEHHLLAIARSAAPTTREVKVALPLTIFVSLEKQNDSQPGRLIEALLGSDIYVKHAIVVDADVDVSDLRQVASAIAFHIRPDRGIFVRRQLLGSELDPGCDSPDGMVTKIGIDATLPLSASRPVTRNRVPQGLLDSINISELLRSF
jgi:2,5-furandicarboxylate decarboxylase 1